MTKAGPCANQVFLLFIYLNKNQMKQRNILAQRLSCTLVDFKKMGVQKLFDTKLIIRLVYQKVQKPLHHKLNQIVIFFGLTRVAHTYILFPRIKHLQMRSHQTTEKPFWLDLIIHLCSGVKVICFK